MWLREEINLERSVLNMKGESVGLSQLNPFLFSVAWSAQVVKLVVDWQLAKRRSGCQSTQTRGEVSGSTRKLHRQKGTGRARVGDSRSPTRIGGGVALAPKPRDYGYALNKKVRRLGLRMALSDAAARNKLLLLKDLELPENKTRAFLESMRALNVRKTIVVGTEEELATVRLAARNLSDVCLLPTIGVNVYDILRYPSLIVSEQGLRELEKRLCDATPLCAA